MSLSNFALTKSWENPEDFPTYEAEEAQVRADMQCLFDELAEGLQKLIDELQKYNTGTGAAGANNIGIDAIAGVSAANVQSALAVLRTQIVAATLGTLPDNSIETAKYKDSSITTPKIADGGVTHAKLGSGAVTDNNCDFSAGLDVDGALNVDGAATLGATVTMDGKIFLSANSYGDKLPATAEAGRLFFLEVQEVEE